ncbi:hypothetical protein DdX_19281 [Ditylenchus destructor]|uniref:F-box domain-containing protein n=1 Tax=Ditylenchus destructor TaxID=166010 RepID=A0AAD4QXI9_9BILA|nr:hypothetical protein DdX_19281 [Ditylenchus destructor]
MSSLPNEIFADVTNFLPNNDITDLMLMSRTFNALVTPRLQKIDQEMSTMNQSIKSFMPMPAPDPADNEWITKLDLKRFLPIGSEAKKPMKKLIKNTKFVQYCLCNVHHPDVRNGKLQRLKRKMSLERFDDPTFLRILGALIAIPEFRQEYNIWGWQTGSVELCYQMLDLHHVYPGHDFGDVKRILVFYDDH